MKWLPGAHQEIFTEMKKVMNFVDMKVQEHKRDFDPSSPRDYIDCFLAEMGEVRIFMCRFFLCTPSLRKGKC